VCFNFQLFIEHVSLKYFGGHLSCKILRNSNTDHEQTLDLELQGNDNTSETETYVTMELETEVQIKKIDPEAIYKTPDGTSATVSRAQKVKVFREAATEGPEEQAKEMKATSSTKLQKPTLGQNVRIKITDIDRAKMDPISITAVITDIKDEEFYELPTKLGKLKALYTRNQLTFRKENFFLSQRKFFKHRRSLYGRNKRTRWTWI